MRKQILKALLVAAIVGTASTAMAVTISSSVTVGAGNTFSPSAKVAISLKSTSVSYAATSCHLNGTKMYGSAGGSGLATGVDPSKIYSTAIPDQASNTSGICAPTAPTDATNPGFTTN